MIVIVRVGDAEADDHLVDKGWIGEFGAERPEIGARAKHQLVGPGDEFRVLEKRFVASTVVVRLDGLDQSVGGDGEQIDAHARARLAVGGVEYMRRKSSHRDLRIMCAEQYPGTPRAGNRSREASKPLDT